MKSFAGKQLRTLEGYYGEADRKFRLHHGDILLMSSKFAFAVDPHIGGRSQGSRILSWVVMPQKNDSSLPASIEESKSVVRIDEVTEKSSKAKAYYENESKKFAKDPCLLETQKITCSVSELLQKYMPRH